jgi:hypothetical protein
VSVLFPPGITSLHDCPGPVFDAIRLANFFLSFEEMREEDRPPKSIWLDGEKLNAHLRAVSAKYEREAGGSSRNEEVLYNDAAKDLIVD